MLAAITASRLASILPHNAKLSRPLNFAKGDSKLGRYLEGQVMKSSGGFQPPIN
jgi:hypothetical protein